MAIIILEPGEEFEHCHSTESTTYLIEGRIKYRSEGKSYLLKKGQKVSTPANKWHTLENVGKTAAKFGCGHFPLPRTEDD